MKKFYIWITLSVIGLGIALAVLFYGDLLKPAGGVGIPAIKLPFSSFIAGTGIVEASSRNIAPGSSVSGVVKKLYVQSGDAIKKGTLLLELDDTPLRTEIAVAEAEIKAAEAKRTNAKHQFNLIQKLQKLSPPVVSRQKYLAAKDRLREAEAALAVAKAKRTSLQKQLALYKIYSPIDGIVLRAEIAPGDFYAKDSSALMIGSSAQNVRVSINEYDIAHFQPGTKAVAYIRGTTKSPIPLTYAYTIPYVVPKTALTGRSTERTDTRVLQVIYHVDKAPALPLFAGEQLDVYIETQTHKKGSK